MLKRYHRFFQSIVWMMDSFLVLCSFAMAYTVRFYGGLQWFTQHVPSSEEETSLMAVWLVAIWAAAARFSGLYSSYRTRSWFSEATHILRTTLCSFMLVVTLTYFMREIRYSRAVLLLWVCLNTVLLIVAHSSLRLILRHFRRRGYNLRHLLLIGTGHLANRLAYTIQNESALGLHIVGVLQSDDLLGDTCIEKESLEKEQGSAITFPLKNYLAQIPMLGSVSKLEEICQSIKIDQVWIALPIEQAHCLPRIMEVLSKQTVDVQWIPDFYRFMTLCGSVEEFDGMPLIHLQASPLMGWNRVAKRCFDILVASLLFLLALPIGLILALLLKLGSSGPIFFRQERVGLDGHRFAMLKFRTMYVNAEEQGAVMAHKDDPRCTAIGSWMRRFSLDELPQLWNVLMGDMSLVGPRPERPCFIKNFKETIPRYALRHKIKSGITGLAQVKGLRGETSIEQRIALDLYYIEHWSLLLDFKILLRTVFGGFLSPNAY